MFPRKRFINRNMADSRSMTSPIEVAREESIATSGSLLDRVLESRSLFPGLLYPWDGPPQPVDESICLVVRNAGEGDELRAQSGFLQLGDARFRRTDRHDFIAA